MSNRGSVPQIIVDLTVLLAAMFTASVWAVFFYLAGASVVTIALVWLAFFAIAGGILKLISSGRR